MKDVCAVLNCLGRMIWMESLKCFFLYLFYPKRSLYRDLLFLTLVALGKNNINISKFTPFILASSRKMSKFLLDKQRQAESYSSSENYSQHSKFSHFYIYPIKTTNFNEFYWICFVRQPKKVMHTHKVYQRLIHNFTFFFQIHIRNVWYTFVLILSLSQYFVQLSIA